MNRYELLNKIISLYNSNSLDNEFYDSLSKLISILVRNHRISINYADELTNDILLLLYTKISNNTITSMNNIDKYILKIIPIYYSKVNKRYSNVVSSDRSEIIPTPSHSRKTTKTYSSNYEFIIKVYDKYTRYRYNSEIYHKVKLSYLLSVYNILVNKDDSIILYRLDNSYYSYIRYLISVLHNSILKEGV